MGIKQELFFGNDIHVNDHITISQPKVGQILDYHADNKEFQDGELGYYKMLSLITATPADYDVQLDDAGVRYEDVDPFEFFFGLVKMFHVDATATGLIFGDLDLTKFDRFRDPEHNDAVIYMNPDGVRIDNALYMHITSIVRAMHNITPNTTKWENDASRQIHLDYERKRSKRKQHKNDKPILLPIISALVNDPGFKYNREETLNLNIYFLYDCLKQRMKYQQVDHLMTGVYVGLIDTKKMNLAEELNMIRDDM